jgi:hypothetical protein
MSYVARWEQLKKDFEKTTGLERPKLVKDSIIGTIQKASGITPVLKDLDSAIAKKQRAPIAQAITKFMTVRGPYVEILMKETGHCMANDDDVLAMAYTKLQSGLQKIAADASEELKSVQEAKSPGTVAVDLLEIEGDIKATIATAKKDLTAFAALEKKHKVIATADTALKEAEKYTKAAARIEYATAVDALTKFKAAAKKAAEDLGKVITAEKSSDKFTTAVTKFQKAMKDFSTVQRVDQQITKLQEAEKKKTAAG